jgi:hypothetical protein
MSPVKSSPVSNTATPQPKTRLEVFVSYAEEDAQLVNEITEELSKPFASLLKFFVDTDTIKDGDRWREKINERLDSADILLIISTGQLKESHDFPGFEVGYFSRSIKERPTIDGKIKRQIIPINIGAKPPSAVLDIQGVVIRKEDLLNFELVPGDLSSEENFLEKLPENNAFRKLLRRLREILTGVSQMLFRAPGLTMRDFVQQILAMPENPEFTGACYLLVGRS